MRLIDRELLDSVTARAQTAPRLRMNHNFHQSDGSRCHRLLNGMEPGSYIRPHRHLDPEKDECFIVLRGRIGILTFDDNGGIESTAVIGPGMEAAGCDLPSGRYHTAVSLETGTVFYESKAGPYIPIADNELAPWAPQENTPEVPEYLGRLVNALKA